MLDRLSDGHLKLVQIWFPLQLVATEWLKKKRMKVLQWFSPSLDFNPIEIIKRAHLSQMKQCESNVFK